MFLLKFHVQLPLARSSRCCVIETRRRYLIKTTNTAQSTHKQIEEPKGAHTIDQRAVSSGVHTFTVPIDGRYTYCFSNDNYAAATKEVSFNVHGVVYVPEPTPGSPPNDPLEHEIRQLSDLLSQVKDEQEYIVMRERNHRNTAESTNSRVKWWSIFQLGVVAGNSMWQIWWIRRFFEVKRVV